MTFPAQLTSGQLDSLRGTASIPPTYAATQYICFCPNTAVFRASVKQTPLSTGSYAELLYQNVTTGAYTDIKVGQTIQIVDGTSGALKFIGRIRKAATSTKLFINETSDAISAGGGAVSPDLILVIDDYRLWGKLGRIASNVYYKDWDETFSQLKPIIYNLQSAYAGIVSGSPSGYTIAFSALAVAATSGATISTYSWSIGDGTVTSGSTATANVTVRFPAGFRWVSLTVTDNGSRSQTRRIPVWAVPTDLSSQVSLDFNGAQIEGALETGWIATIEAFNGISAIMDNTLCCIFSVQRYNNTETQLFTNVEFVGRIQKGAQTLATDPDHLYSRTTTFELEGIGAQLQRTSAPTSLLMQHTNGTPTAWDTIKNLTVWRAIAYLLEHSTFHTICSLSFDATDNTYIAQSLGTQAGNLYDVMMDLGMSVNYSPTFAQSGELYLARDLRYQDVTARAGLETTNLIATWGMADMIGWTIERSHIQRVGVVNIECGSYNTTSNTVTPYLALFPGIAQGPGDGKSTLGKQILAANATKTAAESDVKTRAKGHFATVNDFEKLTITHLDGYGWLVPSTAYLYGADIATADGGLGDMNQPRNHLYGDTWLLTHVSSTHHNETGAREIEAEYTRLVPRSLDLRECIIIEPQPGSGQKVPPDPNPYPFPERPPHWPPFGNRQAAYLSTPESPILTAPITAANPAPTLAALQPIDNLRNGNTVLLWTNANLWLAFDFVINPTPRLADITPPLGASETVKSAVWNGYGPGAYVLVSDGVKSRVFYTTNIFAGGIYWQAGRYVAGVYTQIKVTATPGEVYLYCASTNDESLIVPVDGTSVATANTTNSGTSYTVIISGSFIVNNTTTPNILSDGVYWTDDNWYTATYATYRARLEATNWPDPGAPDLRHVYTQTKQGNSTTFTFDLNESNYANNSGNFVAHVIPATDNTSRAKTCYSSDYGATFAIPRNVGTLISGFGGLDTSKIGSQVIASASGQTYKASAGGAYSSYGGAKGQGALWIPRYNFSSTTTENSGTTPEYLLAAAALDTSESLWKVTASGATFTAISPSNGGNKGLAISGNCIAMSAHGGFRIATILSYAGTRRLAVTTNASTWSDRGSLTSSADHPRYRKGDTTEKELYWVNQLPYYSPDHGITAYAKTMPFDATATPVKGIEVYE